MVARTFSTALFLLFAVTAPALGLSPEARSAGMGGAYSALSSGAEGIWWNPATQGMNLVSVVMGGGLEASNNALGLSRVMGILSDDATEKEKAVADVRKEGKWEGLMEAVGGAGLEVWGFGVGVFPRGVVRADEVSPDAVEYALLGSVPLKTSYDFSGTYTRSVFTEVSLGYGKQVFEFPGILISAGAALKYFHGLDYEYLKTDQKFTVGPYTPVSSTEKRAAKSGKGFGADVGLHAEAAGIAKASVVLKNIASKIKWDADVEKGGFDTSTLAFSATSGVDEVSQDVPTVLLLGLGGTVPVVGTSLVGEIEVDTTNSDTRLRAGLEQKILGIIMPRIGIATGAAGADPMITLGLGVGALLARVDLAAGIGLDGKGGALGASGCVAF